MVCTNTSPLRNQVFAYLDELRQSDGQFPSVVLSLVCNAFHIPTAEAEMLISEYERDMGYGN